MNKSVRHGAVERVAITAPGRGSRRAAARYLAAIVVMTAANTAVAQDALGAARALYQSAAYDEALVRLNTLRATAHPGDEARFVEQYRAFCLLALGRTVEAERAMEAVITVAPSFRPSEADESPRVRSAFTEVRRRVLPGIIEQEYTQAKAALERHDSVSARAGFQRVLDLLADVDIAAVANQPPLSDIRALAVGFRELSAAAPSRRAPAATVGAPVAAPVEPPSPASAGVPAAQAATDRIYGVEDGHVVRPLALRESWAPLADVFAVRTGVIEIVIDETGSVETATMSVGVNAVYDRLALTEAKRWRYKPATLDGVPVKFRKVILLDLKAAR
ncbi:MAG: hypothetical protein V7647_1368 [Acidobacteriota bacterium]